MDIIKQYDVPTNTLNPNSYYNPTWCSGFFEKILTYFPSWTALIRETDCFNIVLTSAKKYFSPYEREDKKFSATEFIERN